MDRVSLPKLPPERRPDSSSKTGSYATEKRVDLASSHGVDDSKIDLRSRQSHSQMSISESHGTLRRHLPGIEAYAEVVKFRAEAPQRVLLRLERLVGTATICPVDFSYMETLRGKLKEEETRTWHERAKIRRKGELDRCRKLAINGHADPDQGMEDIYDHPVYRVNQMLKRLDGIERGIHRPYQVKPPPIVPVEPFEEYAATGLLFGSHPNHHLKPKTGSRRSSCKVKSARGNLRQFREISSSEVPEPPESSTSGAEKEFQVDRKHSEALIRDLEAAKKKYGINPDDIEKMWRSYESPLIKMVNTEEDSIGLFDVSHKVVNTKKREEKFGNDFPHRTYWRLHKNASASKSFKK